MPLKLLNLEGLMQNRLTELITCYCKTEVHGISLNAIK